MQIQAGIYKGMKIRSSPSRDVRPCSSRVKKSIFDTLAARIDFEGITVLDLFAGFGSLGFEAFSRGAGSVWFVDRHPDALKDMKATSMQLGAPDRLRIVNSDVVSFLGRTREQFDLVFCDPPYAWPDYPGLVEKIAGKGVLAEEGMLLIEHSTSVDLGGSLWYSFHKDYGMTRVTFFQR
ncbi:MAG: methyltransferase domain-containing protein [Chlorobiaceae bacterium]|nr:methyltransferase domain-containing protein [Chlorobiaceae bacterium]NTV61402.1 methyltransferase domain-containing protein [Chlorobiaceae bacterium]